MNISFQWGSIRFHSNKTSEEEFAAHSSAAFVCLVVLPWELHGIYTTIFFLLLSHPNLDLVRDQLHALYICKVVVSG